MPRISRFAVEYAIENGNSKVVWIAKFGHLHAKTISAQRVNKKGQLLFHKGTPVIVEREYPVIGKINGREVLVKHATTCTLLHKDAPEVTVTGVSYCSLKDAYLWRKGLRESLRLALEKIHIFPLKRGGHHVEGESPFEPRCNDRGELFNMHMAAFFRELPIRAYWPHSPTGNPAAVAAGIIVGGQALVVKEAELIQ